MEVLIALPIVFAMLYLFTRQFALVIIFCIVALSITGYGMNIGKFCLADFKEPYKEEILRGIGVCMPPVGVVMGYIHIEDGDE